MKRDKKGIQNYIIYKPKNINQEKYLSYLDDENVDLVIALGPAGTGKTLFACLKAVNMLKNGEINKLVITRPVVPVEEEEIGFLPGNIVKKMDPWTKPIFELFLEFFSKSELDNFIYNGMIEISPLAFMRGRTFKNSFIIADEMQNSSPNQMKMLTTRIGYNSKMVITGDLNQTDIINKNGLKDFITKLNEFKKEEFNISDTIKIVDFENNDIERSDIVKKIIKIYEHEAQKCNNLNEVKKIYTENTNSTAKIKIKNAKKPSYFSSNDDAALIPKKDVPKNTDIFWDSSNI